MVRNEDAEEWRRKKFERKYSKHFSLFRCIQERIGTISRFVSFQLRFYFHFLCFAVFYKTKALPKTHTHRHIHLPSLPTPYNSPPPAPSVPHRTKAKRGNKQKIKNPTCIGQIDSMRTKHFTLNVHCLSNKGVFIAMCIGCHFYERNCEWKQSICTFAAEVLQSTRPSLSLVGAKSYICMMCTNIGFNRPHIIHVPWFSGNRGADGGNGSVRKNRDISYFTCMPCGGAILWVKAERFPSNFLLMLNSFIIIIEIPGKNERGRWEKKINGAKWSRVK